jgi:hypothetical protein
MSHNRMGLHGLLQGQLSLYLLLSTTSIKTWRTRESVRVLECSTTTMLKQLRVLVLLLQNKEYKYGGGGVA